jgi:Predicted phosphoribosyltransferases
MGREVSLGKERFLLLGWDDIVSGVEELANKVLASGFRPDVIVGILRGGLFVANLLSDVMDVEEVVPLGIRSYVGVKSRGTPVVYHRPSLEGLNGKRVLLVDDVSDEGKTLMTAHSLIRDSAYPADLRTSVLHIKPWTRFVPDYYVLSTSHWILYPWSRYESARLLWRQMSAQVPSEDLLSQLSSLLASTRRRSEGWCWEPSNPVEQHRPKARLCSGYIRRRYGTDGECLGSTSRATDARPTSTTPRS